MPKIYRAMKASEGKPLIGETATTLGVRVPDDIEADSDGLVHSGTGGMSVSPSVADLPPWRVPRRLQSLIPRASGRDNEYIWSMGTGPFAAEAVAEHLLLRPDPQHSGHGFVEPDAVMSLDDYRSALAATRDAWSIDEK